MFRTVTLVLATAAALLGPGLGLAQVSFEERFAPGQPPAIIGNLSLRGAFPENSLAGIQHAIENSIDMVKVDVQITRDGQYILMHDASLDRTTNVTDVFPDGSPHRAPQPAYARDYLVRDFSLEDIRRLRLRDEQGGDHPVPLLDEALELIDQRIPVILNLGTYEIDSLAPLLATRATENLLLWSQSDPLKLRDTVAATGIGAYMTLGRAQDPVAGLDRLFDKFGPQLKMVDVMSKRLTPEFQAMAEELGVLVALAGDFFEDHELTRGDPGPWLEAFDSGAVAFWTRQPYAVMDLLGR